MGKWELLVEYFHKLFNGQNNELEALLNEGNGQTLPSPKIGEMVHAIHPNLPDSEPMPDD